MSDIEDLKLGYENITRDQGKYHARNLANAKELRKIELDKQQQEILRLTRTNGQLTGLRVSRFDDVAELQENLVARLRKQLEEKDAILKESSETVARFRVAHDDLKKRNATLAKENAMLRWEIKDLCSATLKSATLEPIGFDLDLLQKKLKASISTSSPKIEKPSGTA